jgi:hypothetical protein
MAQVAARHTELKGVLTHISCPDEIRNSDASMKRVNDQLGHYRTVVGNTLAKKLPGNLQRKTRPSTNSMAQATFDTSERARALYNAKKKGKTGPKPRVQGREKERCGDDSEGKKKN